MNQNLVGHQLLDPFGGASFKSNPIAGAAAPTENRLDRPFAVWKEEYHTGDRQIDREHQELFDLVNSLHNAMLRGEDQMTLKLILEKLAIHTLAHFQQEEMLMQSCDYPRYDRHKQSHDGLKTKVVDLLEKFNLEAASLPVAVTRFLTDWLVHHIQGEDRKLTEFLHTQPTLDRVEKLRDRG